MYGTEVHVDEWSGSGTVEVVVNGTVLCQGCTVEPV